MVDGQEAKPSFKQAVAKKALAPVAASVATAATTYVMRKAAQVWQETIQPKVEEKGGAEALARQAADAVSTKLAPVSDAVSAKAGHEPGQGSDDDRSEERRKREQRRQQRRKALDQAGSG